MTKEELTLGTSSVLRHLLTVGAGILAAHGLAGGDQLVSIGGSLAVFIATLAWSFLEKSKLLSAICAALPVSELQALAADLIAFKAKGSNPLLISHIASTILAVANAELVAQNPELVTSPLPEATVAPEPQTTAPAPPPPAPNTAEQALPPEAAPVTGGAQPIPDGVTA